VIIDFHLHLFDVENFVDDLVRKMDAAGVDRTVLQPLPPFRFKGEICCDNEAALRAVKAHPDRLVGSVYVDPRDDECPAQAPLGFCAAVW